LITGGAGLKDLSGPVGIVEVISQVGTQAETRSDAWQSIIYIAALVAANLAFVNLLPIPALDGGRGLFPDYQRADFADHPPACQSEVWKAISITPD
jgi:regulator of sigma E protease